MLRISVMSHSADLSGCAVVRSVVWKAGLHPQAPGNTTDRTFLKSRAIAQAVSRWLPTAAAQVRGQVWSLRICGGRSDSRVGFLRVPLFPLPIFIPQIAPQSLSSIIWGWYNSPKSCRSTMWTQSHHMRNILKKFMTTVGSLS
jgi:hypothetical protein